MPPFNRCVSLPLAGEMSRSDRGGRGIPGPPPAAYAAVLPRESKLAVEGRDNLISACAPPACGGNVGGAVGAPS